MKYEISAQYNPRENVIRTYLAVGNLKYSSNTNVSRKFCVKDIWELPRKKLNYTIIQCHSVHLKTLYLCNIDNLRKKTEYAPYFQLFYELVCISLSDNFEININLIQFTSVLEKYQIIRKNIYNFNKKGFMIGIDNIAAQVITLEEMKSGKIIGAS